MQSSTKFYFHAKGRLDGTQQNCLKRLTQVWKLHRLPLQTFLPIWAGMPGQGYNLQLDDNLPRRLRSSGNGRDIFAMVKMSMSHDVLSQPPLLVYPHMLLSNTEAFFNKVNQADAPVLTAKLEDSRCDELRELSSQLEKDFPHLSRGARYLRQLTEPDRHRGPCCNLNFIDAGPRAGLGSATGSSTPRTKAIQTSSCLSPSGALMCPFSPMGESWNLESLHMYHKICLGPWRLDRGQVSKRGPCGCTSIASMNRPVILVLDWQDWHSRKSHDASKFSEESILWEPQK